MFLTASYRIFVVIAESNHGYANFPIRRLLATALQTKGVMKLFVRFG